MRLDPENRQRLLRLLESAPRPAVTEGAPPTVDDLIALGDNTLTPERRRQVLAWLASDGELTRDWVQMQQDWTRVRDELQKKPLPVARRTTWRWLGPLTGLAAVATIVGMLVVPVWQGDPTAALDDLAWPDDVRPLHWTLGAKSAVPAVETPDPTVQAAFAAGVAAVLARAPTAADWARLRGHYAERGATSTCPGVCSIGQREAWQRGRWAARARLVCLSETSPPETMQVLIAARPTAMAAEASAGTDLRGLCAEAERWFERYE